MTGKEKSPTCTHCSSFISCPLLAELFLLYLRNWAMFLVGFILLFRTGSKNSEDDPADDREETLCFDWF